MTNNIVFSISNIWIILLIALPNFLYAKYPPTDKIENTKRPKRWIIILAFEKLGQIGTMALPFLWRFEVDTTYKWIVFYTMWLCLVIYYACWIRYFTTGRKLSMLYTNFLFIPIPMAISPVIYYGCVSYLLTSPILGFVTILFAIGHILESLLVSKSCKFSND